MNTLVDAYRQQAPNDPRSDDELTLALGAQHEQDGSFADVPDFLSDYQQVKERTSALADLNKPNLGERAGRVAGQVVGSVGRAIADVPAGLAESLGIATARLDAERGYAKGASDMDSPVALAQADQPKPEDTLAYKFGGAIRRSAESVLPAAVPELNDSFWATKLPSTLGSIIGFIGAGGLEKAFVKGSLDAVVKAMADDVLKEAAKSGLSKAAQETVSTAILGAGTQAAGAYKEAIAKGATPEDATKAFWMNMPVGASMALPVGSILGEGKTLLGKTLSSGATGAAVIGAQQVAGNIIAQKTFDPNRKTFEGVGESATAGGIVTGALGALFHKLGGATPATEPLDPAISQRWKGVPSDQLAEIALLVSRKEAGKSTLSDETVLKNLDPGQQAFATAYGQMSKEQKAAYVTPETLPHTPEPPVEEQATVSPTPPEEIATAPATAPEPTRVASPEVAAARARAATSVVESTLNPVQQAMRDKVARAASETDTAPTVAQKDAGNYQKGKVTIDGMEISIENPKGSERTGTGPDGKPWTVTMPDHYGYFLGTLGKDKDHVDVTIGPNPTSDKAFVIDQIDPKTGEHDEAKTFIGFDSQQHALDSYDASFSDGSGPARRGAVTEMTKDQLKSWLKTDATKKPVAYVKPERKVGMTAADVLAKPLGSTSAKEMTEMSDSELHKLGEERTGEVNAFGRRAPAFVVHRDSAVWGSSQPKEILPELGRLRTEAHKKSMDALTSGDETGQYANSLRREWYSGAIEGVKNEGDNYDKAVAEGHIKPKEVASADSKQKTVEVGSGESAGSAPQVSEGKPGEVQKPAGAGGAGETQKQEAQPGDQPPLKLNKPKLTDKTKEALSKNRERIDALKAKLAELEKKKPSAPFEIRKNNKEGGFVINPIEGLDPEKFAIYAELTKEMFARGLYKFNDFAAAMYETVGEPVLHYVTRLYESAREGLKAENPETARKLDKVSDMSAAIDKFHSDLAKREVRKLEPTDRIGPEQVDVEGQGVQAKSGRGGGGNTKAREAWEEERLTDESLPKWEDLSDDQKENYIAATPGLQQTARTLRPAWFIPSAKDKSTFKNLSEALLSGARRSTESAELSKSWVHTLAAVLDRLTGQVHLVSVFEDKGVKVTKFTNELGNEGARYKALMLKDVVTAKMENGENRYDVIGSARTGDLHQYYQQDYATRAEFRKQFQNDLVERTKAVEAGYGSQEAVMERTGQRNLAAEDEEAQKASDLEKAAGTREAGSAGLPTTEEGAVDVVQQEAYAPKTEEKPLNLEPKDIEALKRLPLDKDGKLRVDDLADLIKQGPEAIDDELLDVIERIVDPRQANQKEFFTRIEDAGLERALKEYGYKIDTTTAAPVERSGSPATEGNLQPAGRSVPSRPSEPTAALEGGQDRAGQPRQAGAQGNEKPDSTGGSDSGVRFSDRPDAPQGAATGERLQSQWEANLQSAADSGIGVTVLRGLHEGGQFDAENRAAVLTVADHLNPTADNIVLQIHELGAHPAFDALTPEQKAMLYRAAERLGTPEGFKAKIAEAIKGEARRAEVTAEENLVEAVSRNLAAEGFNPTDARTFGGTIVRLLKDLYYRTSLALQRGMLGEDHVNPDLARRWFENRVKSFMAGDKSPMSFLSALGGPKADLEKQAGEHTPAGGSGSESAIFNYDSGTMEYAEALPDSMRALRYNQEGSRLAREREQIGREATDELTHEDGGYKTEEEFHKDYEENALHDDKETRDEFLRRRHCQEQPSFNIGQSVERGGKNWKITGFDTDGEPLVEALA